MSQTVARLRRYLWLWLVKFWQQILVPGAGELRQLPLEGKCSRAAPQGFLHTQKGLGGSCFNILLHQTNRRETAQIILKKPI